MLLKKSNQTIICLLLACSLFVEQSAMAASAAVQGTQTTQMVKPMTQAEMSAKVDETVAKFSQLDSMSRAAAIDAQKAKVDELSLAIVELQDKLKDLEKDFKEKGYTEDDTTISLWGQVGGAALLALNVLIALKTFLRTGFAKILWKTLNGLGVASITLGLYKLEPAKKYQYILEVQRDLESAQQTLQFEKIILERTQEHFASESK